MSSPAIDDRPAEPNHRHSVAAQWRLGIALLIGAATLAVTSGAWLADTGAGGFSISPPVGLPASGNIADVSPMTASLVGRNGGAQLDLGVNVARIAVTPSYAARMRVSIAWVNAAESKAALGNSNAYVRVGIYHPVSMSTIGDTSGPCAIHGNPNDSPYVSIYDDQVGTSTPICVALDGSADGTSAQLDGGKLLLSKSQVSGFLEPAMPAPGSALNQPCTTTTSAWCQAFDSPGQAVYYVVAELVAPGGGAIPSHVGDLQFYVKADALP